MIDSQHIIDPAQILNPRRPPAVPVLRHVFPVKERISPQLSVRRKAIRRAARDLLRYLVFIQLEELRMRPHIHTVQGYIDGKVADDLHPMGIGIRPERFPLRKEQILHDFPETDFFFILYACCSESCLIPVPKPRLPFLPGPSVMDLLQRHKQRIIIEPVGIFPTEDRIVFRHVRTEALCRLPEHGITAFIYSSVIGLQRIRAPVPIFILCAVQQSLRTQSIQINKIQIACIGRKGLVRRIPVTGRADRQHLPVALSGCFQKIHKAFGLCAHGANSVF